MSRRGLAPVSWPRTLRLIARATGWLRRPARRGPIPLDIEALPLETSRDLGFRDGRPVRLRNWRD